VSAEDLDPVTALAERRILEAMEAGAFDDLPGRGRPLELDDDSHVPTELRAAYRILKNAGMVPPEVELRREIASAEQLLAMAQSDEQRASAYRRWRLLQARLAVGRARGNPAVERAYLERILEKLGDDRDR
jgi:hypothetical protein